jgi:hypothetical protein
MGVRQAFSVELNVDLPRFIVENSRKEFEVTAHETGTYLNS